MKITNSNLKHFYEQCFKEDESHTGIQILQIVNYLNDLYGPQTNYLQRF